MKRRSCPAVPAVGGSDSAGLRRCRIIAADIGVEISACSGKIVLGIVIAITPLLHSANQWHRDNLFLIVTLFNGWQLDKYS
jgi:hypothetical protein